MQGEFWVDINIDVTEQRGVLATLASIISQSDANIGNITVDSKNGRHNAVIFSISVFNRVHLARVIRRLRANSAVLRLFRKKGP